MVYIKGSWIWIWKQMLISTWFECFNVKIHWIWIAKMDFQLPILVHFSVLLLDGTWWNEWAMGATRFDETSWVGEHGMFGAHEVGVLLWIQAPLSKYYISL
jgi:hypothetical protein